jgi:FkbM family methyltransferase
VPLQRPGTFDAAIWTGVEREYPTLPRSFQPGEIVLDVGCHTGAVCALAARRGATVFGYEANRENYALAVINLHDVPSVTLHHAAVWRSDEAAPRRLTFTPSADSGNTGGGSVLFMSSDDHWAVHPAENADPAPPGWSLSTHEVETVPLDDVLADLGPVRFLKLDVEGAEFPILLTASRLDLVSVIAGEYHELTDDGMARLAPGARVGDRRYSAALLRECLAGAGFDDMRFVPDRLGRGHFTARRAAAGR